MAVVLDHLIIPVKDKEESGPFLARMLGIPHQSHGAFTSLHVGDTILDFSTREPVPRLHYAFKVSDPEFEQVMERLKAENIPYGSEPGGKYNGETNERAGGRGVYFPDPCGHSWEVITATYQ